MKANQKLINEWLAERNIELKPYFTDRLRDLAIPYGKSII